MAIQKIVVDSSVIVKWVNQKDEVNIDQSDRLLLDCQDGKVSLITSELAKYEVGNVLWKKGVELSQAAVCLGVIYTQPIEFVLQGKEEAIEAMEIAIRSKITFYDATMVGLARKLGATLVTDNPKHMKKFGGVRVVALKDYLVQ